MNEIEYAELMSRVRALEDKVRNLVEQSAALSLAREDAQKIDDLTPMPSYHPPQDKK